MTPSPPDLRSPSAPPSRPPIRQATRTISAIAIALFPIRIFLGLGWLRAAVEKLIDPSWWNGDALRSFLDEQAGHALPFTTGLSEMVFEPLALPISYGVTTAQLAIAVGFVSTRFLRPALWAAITLNVVFVAMGAVTPSVFYLVIELTLLAALNHGLIGDDRRPPRTTDVGIKAGLGLAMLPYVATVHPADVIDDPAIILATVALLAAATDGLSLVSAPGRSPAGTNIAGPVTERRRGSTPASAPNRTGAGRVP